VQRVKRREGDSYRQRENSYTPPGLGPGLGLVLPGARPPARGTGRVRKARACAGGSEGASLNE
jgi:hypothetical protein